MAVAGIALAACAFLIAAAIGSFLNVVIYRVPLGLSIIQPASRCPSCDTPVKAHHNLPVFGWLILGGKCAACRTPISARYPLIELMVGLFGLGLWLSLTGGDLNATGAVLASKDVLLDVVIPFIAGLLFIALMVANLFIDLDWFLLPDGLTLPWIAVGVLCAGATTRVFGVDLTDSLVGAAAGAGVILTIIIGYGALTGRAGMGGGDWKLLAVIGAFLGWRAVPWALAVGSIQGLIFVSLFRRDFAVSSLPPDPRDRDAAPVEMVAAPAEGEPELRHLAIPFGPFLALAALEWFVLRKEILALASEFP